MSFPSGHVILVAAISGLLALSLQGELVWIPWLLTLLVMLGRMYVGAHNPLDVTAGLGAGMLIGAGLLFVVAWL
jgi:membrane-associated phospholipid phosphatase